MEVASGTWLTRGQRSSCRRSHQAPTSSSPAACSVLTPGEELPPTAASGCAPGKGSSLRCSERARLFAQTRPAKEFKYGYCGKHKRAYVPWVYQSGCFAGRCGAVCPLFLQRNEEVADGKPACWSRVVFPDSKIEMFPRAKRELFHDLKNCLRRGGIAR